MNVFVVVNFVEGSVELSNLTKIGHTQIYGNSVLLYEYLILVKFVKGSVDFSKIGFTKNIHVPPPSRLFVWKIIIILYLIIIS